MPGLTTAKTDNETPGTLQVNSPPAATDLASILLSQSEVFPFS